MLFTRRPPPWAVQLAAQLTAIEKEIKTPNPSPLKAADVSFLTDAISDLQQLVPNLKGTTK